MRRADEGSMIVMSHVIFSISFAVVQGFEPQPSPWKYCFAIFPRGMLYQLSYTTFYIVSHFIIYG